MFPPKKQLPHRLFFTTKDTEDTKKKKLKSQNGEKNRGKSRHLPGRGIFFIFNATKKPLPRLINKGVGTIMVL